MAMSNAVSLVERAAGGALVVGSWRCDSRSSYLDLQEFIEDSMFEFIDASCGFDLGDDDSWVDFTLHRQREPEVLNLGQKLLQIINVDSFGQILDLPYVYAHMARDFWVFVFDNCQSYLAVFVKVKTR